MNGRIISLEFDRYVCNEYTKKNWYIKYKIECNKLSQKKKTNDALFNF